MADVTIFAAGQEKRLFTVRETPNDDLIVTLKRGALAGGIPTRIGHADNSVPSLIKQSRYTIHPSDAAPTGNLINYHYDGKHGETFNGRFWTDAIKARNGFAPVTQVWVADVRAEGWSTEFTSARFLRRSRRAKDRHARGSFAPSFWSRDDHRTSFRKRTSRLIIVDR
ncbi:MAG: hypothetical protein WA908_07050 [Pontixanthobacter sp.]